MNRNALAQLAAEVWAIERSALESIITRLDSIDLPRGTSLFSPPSAEQLADLDARFTVRRVAAAAGDVPEAATRPGPKSGTVAVVPVYGPIMRRDSLFTWLFGGTSVERLSATIAQLAGDESVSTIVLDVDSPGGTSAGMPELAEQLRAARDVKNVVSIANPVMASAAYWIACQADDVVAAEISLTGSIGCFTMHEDISGMLEQLGVTVTYIYAGDYKVEGVPEMPLTDDAKAHLQGIVDDAYRLFVNDVAAGRKVDAAKVKSDFGQGRAFTATDAKKAGLIDRVGSLTTTVGRLVGSRGMAAPAGRAEADLEEPAALVETGTEVAAAFGSAAAEAERFTADINELAAVTADEHESNEREMRSQRWRIATL